MRAPALVIALVIAGCGGKPAPATAPPPDNEAPASATPIYAALFEPGASWTFDVEYVHSDYDENDQYVDYTEQHVLSCHVDTVAHHGDTDVSEVVCDDAWPTVGGEVPLRGSWAMNPRGLWMVDVGGDPMIANPPAPWELAETDPDSGDTVSESSLSGTDDAWCWSTRSTQGDSYWQQLCFGPDGPAGGGYGWSGGAEYSTTFTLTSQPEQAFAGLFTDDASWTFDVVTGGGLTTSVTCDVARSGETSVAITCGDGWPGGAGDPLTGAWTMNAEGVWRHDALVIAAVPVAGETQLDIPSEGPATMTLAQHGDAWCWSTRIDYFEGREQASMCVGPDGPTEGMWGGDDDHVTTFTRTR